MALSPVPYTRWLRALRSAGQFDENMLALGARLLNSNEFARRTLMGLAFPAGDLALLTADDTLLDG